MIRALCAILAFVSATAYSYNSETQSCVGKSLGQSCTLSQNTQGTCQMGSDPVNLICTIEKAAHAAYGVNWSKTTT